MKPVPAALVERLRTWLHGHPLAQWLLIALLGAGGGAVLTESTRTPSTPTPHGAGGAGSVQGKLRWDYAREVPGHTGFVLRQCERKGDEACTMQGQPPVLGPDVRTTEVKLPPRPYWVCAEVVALFGEDVAQPSERVCLTR